jgi:hypothetical protein
MVPAAVLLWIIGWTMMWVGDRRERKTQTETSAEERESITIMPMIPDGREQLEARTPRETA